MSTPEPELTEKAIAWRVALFIPAAVAAAFVAGLGLGFMDWFINSAMPVLKTWWLPVGAATGLLGLVFGVSLTMIAPFVTFMAIFTARDGKEKP